MKKLGKAISLLLAAVLLATVIPMSALADSSQPESSLPSPTSAVSEQPKPKESPGKAESEKVQEPKATAAPTATPTPSEAAKPEATATSSATAKPETTAKSETTAKPESATDEEKAEQRFTELLEQYGGYLDEDGKLRSLVGKEVLEKPLAEIYEEAGFPQISLYASNMNVMEPKSTYISNLGFNSNVDYVVGWGPKHIQQTGKVAYCVQHGVSLGFNNSPGYTETELTKEQLNKLSLIDYWGRYKNIAGIQGTDKAVDADWNNFTATADMMAQFYCQALIWETINSWGGSFKGAEYINIPATVDGMENMASQATYDNFKALVTAKVNQFYTTPSISGQTVKLKIGETKTLTDTTGALASYKDTPSFNDTGISISKSGSIVTLTASGTPKPSGKVTFGYDVATAYHDQRSGFYYQHEVTQNVATCGFAGADPAYMVLNVEVEMYGTVKIIKTAEDGIVSGFQFKVSGNGVDTTVTTGADGTIAVPNLLPGTYTVAEVNTPGRYTQPGSQSVTVSANTTATVNFNNVLKKGSLSVQKASEDGIISGFTFRINSNYGGYGTAQWDITTNGSGIAALSDLPKYDNANNLIRYTVAETNVPIRYTSPDGQTVTVDSNPTAPFNNLLKKAKIKIIKTAEDGDIEGKTFELKSNYSGYGQDTWTLTTDKNGIASSPDLPVYDKSGNKIIYTAKETNVTIEYIAPGPQSSTLTENTEKSFTFVNNLKKGSLIVKKTSQDKEVEGMTFRVKADFGYNGKVTWEIKSDRTGLARQDDLPIYNKSGVLIKYTVEETNVPIRYITPDKQVVTVDKTPELPFNNKLKEGYIRVVKESEDGEIKGVKFTVKSNYSGYGKDTWEIVTGEDGTAMTGPLPKYDKTGKEIKYTVVETGTEIRYVEPGAQTATVQQGLKTELTFKNQLKKGFIRVVKESEDGVIAGVKFTIKSNYSGYGKDTWEIVTGEDGTAMTEPLPRYNKAGEEIKYTVVETGTELRYVDPDGQEITLQTGLKSTLHFKNLLKKGLIRISKESEDGEVTGLKFKLSGNGKEHSGVTDDKGQMVFKDLDIYDIHNEKIVYTLLEYDVPVRYIQPEEQQVTIIDPYTEAPEDSTESKTLPDIAGKENTTAVSFMPKKALGKPMTLSVGGSDAFLASAASEGGLEAWWNGLWDDTAGAEPDSAPSAEDIPEAETKPTILPRPVPDFESIFAGHEVSFKNNIKKGVVTVTKVSSVNTDEKLSGAVFTVYADQDGNGKYNADIDQKQCSLKETDKGVYQSEKLLYGKYLLVEETAPKGFNRDGKHYAFEIKADNETVVVGNKGALFVNVPVSVSPKTGDTGSIGWSVLALLIAAGILAVVIIPGKIKNRKR